MPWNSSKPRTTGSRGRGTRRWRKYPKSAITANTEKAGKLVIDLTETQRRKLVPIGNGEAGRRVDMERLTKKGDGVRTALCNYGIAPYPVVTQEIIDRLAAYEDTGLTPEAVQQLRWIPVEERLPEEEGAYIVCVDGAVMWDAYCMFEGKERWLCYDGRPSALYIDPYSGKPLRQGPYPRVTHWMPLPAAPKEEAYEK